MKDFTCNTVDTSLPDLKMVLLWIVRWQYLQIELIILFFISVTTVGGLVKELVPYIQKLILHNIFKSNCTQGTAIDWLMGYRIAGREIRRQRTSIMKQEEDEGAFTQPKNILIDHFDRLLSLLNIITINHNNYSYS